VLIAAASMGGAAAAQEARAVARTGGERSNRVAEVVPGAGLIQPNIYNSDGELSIVQFRGAFPFKLGWIGKAPLRIQSSYEHNFIDEAVGPEDTLGLALKLPVGARSRSA
jgi:hypothetical protein